MHRAFTGKKHLLFLIECSIVYVSYTQRFACEVNEMDKLFAGAARREITTRDPSALVHDPLWVKALILKRGDTTAAFLSLDTICLGGGIGDLSDDFVPALHAALPGIFLVVGTTHTHTPVPPMLREESEVLDACVEAVHAALAAAVPARFGTGAGSDTSFALNRSVPLTDGTWWSVRQAHPAPPDDQVSGIAPEDPTIDLLKVESLDGSPIAALFCFGCHPLVGFASNAITANYPGIAERVVEEHWGGVAMLFQSTGGDVTERDYKQYDRPKSCVAYGQALGLSVLRGLAGITCGDTDFDTACVHTAFHRRRDIKERIAEMHAEEQQLLSGIANSPLNFKTFLPLYLKYQLDPAHPLENAAVYAWEDAHGQHDLADQDAINRKNIAKYLDNLRILDRLVWLRACIETHEWHEAYNASFGYADVPAEICGVRLGDALLITAPVEMLTAVGQNLRARSPFSHTLICSYANGYMHYGAPADAYQTGSYETIECFLDPSWEADYYAAVDRIIARLKR